MLKVTATFNGFSVDNIETARQFYSDTLGLKTEATRGGISLVSPESTSTYIYEKADHAPASFTVLNLVVADIALVVEELVASGIKFEMYLGLHQDAQGIACDKRVGMGPNIAWFKDPAGNVLALLEQ